MCARSAGGARGEAPAWLGALVACLGRNRLAVLAAVGYGLIRCCSSLAVWHAGGEAVPSGDAGKLAGMLALLLALYLPHGGPRPFAVQAAPCACALAGCAVGAVCVALGEPPSWLSGAAQLLIGAGTAAMMLQWLGWVGRLPARKIALVIGAAELFNSLVAVVASANPAVLAVYLGLFVCVSGLLLAVCDQGMPASGQGRAPSYRAPRALFGPSFAKTVAWTAVFCFAFGYVDSVVGLARASVASSLGNMVPGAVLLVLAAAVPERYDIRVLNRLSLALMAAGLLLAMLLPGPGPATLFVASAAASSSRISSYAMACIQARWLHVSSVLPAAVVKAVVILAMNLGDLAGACASGPGFLLLGGLTLAAVLAVSLVFSPFDVAERTAYRSDERPSFDEALAREAAARGLSNREATVFALMARGRSTAEVSEELFISKSAVRAHASRVYEKFGVHSRAELDGAVAELRRSAGE